MSSPEQLQANRALYEPSNLEVMAAFAPSDHLELFWVGNTAKDKLYILAFSKKNARIIALLGGHIRAVSNATFWRPLPKVEPKSALSQAIKAGLPGVIWLREGCVISRDRVFYDTKGKGLQ